MAKKLSQSDHSLGGGAGHYGLGGQIIKNAKGHKNSGSVPKTQDRPEVSKEILLS